MIPREVIKSAMANDLAYLDSMIGQFGIDQALVIARCHDLRALVQAGFETDSYFSIANGMQYGEAPKQAVDSLLSHRAVKASKTSRQKSPKKLSCFTLFNAADKPLLSFHVDHIGEAFYQDDMKGDNGKVKKGHDTDNPDRAYALKKFRVKPGGDHPVTKEKALMKAIRSEFFAKLLDWKTANAFEYQGKHREKVCLVMDWVEGKDLLVLNRDDETMNIPLPLRLKGVLDIVGKLAALHQANLIYQDMKAENIMWTGTAAELIDTESILHDSERCDKPGIFTANYASRELIDTVRTSGDRYILSKFLSKQTDLHALGNALAIWLPELFRYDTEWYYGTERLIFHTMSAATGQHQELINCIERLWLPPNNSYYADATQLFQELHALITTKYQIHYPSEPPKLALSESQIIEQLNGLTATKGKVTGSLKEIEKKIASEAHNTNELLTDGRALATSQLKELIRNVIAKNRHYRGNHAKYTAILTLSNRLENIAVLDNESIARITKVFLRLALQNVGTSLTGKTTSGKDILKLLNTPNMYRSLMIALFPDLPANTVLNYDHLRNLLCDTNNRSIFHKRNADNVFTNFNDHFDTYGIGDISHEMLQVVMPGA